MLGRGLEAWTRVIAPWKRNRAGMRESILENILMASQWLLIGMLSRAVLLYSIFAARGTSTSAIIHARAAVIMLTVQCYY